MKKLLLVTVFAILIACQSNKTQNAQEEALEEISNEYEAPTHHSESMAKIIEAHGGYEQWSKMKTLSYLKEDEATICNLQNRKIRLESPEKTIGFDGNEVWAMPDSADASKARFYHNLFFYFYAMPFIVGDPGAYYEDIAPRELNGKVYNGVKVSYGEGIGDAPKDNYIVWYDPETDKMEWLMYTVTYGNDEANEDYRLIKYDEWEEINSLLLPTAFQWYSFENDTVGEGNKRVVFDKIKITENTPSDSLFITPEGAQIAPR